MGLCFFKTIGVNHHIVVGVCGFTHSKCEDLPLFFCWDLDYLTFCHAAGKHNSLI